MRKTVRKFKRKDADVKVKVYLIYDLTGRKRGYIGQTIDDVEDHVRGYVHLAKRKNEDGSWKDDSVRARAIRKRNYQIGHRVIRTGLKSIWNVAEISLIARYKKQGWVLWNQTDGGEGMLNPSKKTREKIRIKSTGRVVSKKENEARSISLKQWNKENPGAFAGKNNGMFGRGDILRRWNKDHPDAHIVTSKKTLELMSKVRKQWHKDNPNGVRGKNNGMFGRGDILRQWNKEHPGHFAGKNNGMYGKHKVAWNKGKKTGPLSKESLKSRRDKMMNRKKEKQT